MYSSKIWVQNAKYCPRSFQDFTQIINIATMKLNNAFLLCYIIILFSSRYNCVLTQYLLPEETDYYTGLASWMITKCDTEYQIDDIHKCLNPVPDLASVVPVTESAANYRHFRNKHCAHCNFNYKRSPLIEWKLQIQ